MAEGRKYGIGKYGRGTYDLGDTLAEIWDPIPEFSSELWIPEVVIPPGGWVPLVSASAIWAPIDG